MYRVFCPDGKDRLKAHFESKEEARFDAGYFSQRSSCSDWSGDWTCPGGVHTIEPPKAADPLELVWVLDLAG